MYSPKIDEALVPVLYRLAKERRIPMTRFVDRLIRQALTSINLPEGNSRAVNLTDQFPANTESHNAVA